MAVANQQMHDSKRLAILGNSNLLLKLTARDKRLVWQPARGLRLFHALERSSFRSLFAFSSCSLHVSLLSAFFSTPSDLPASTRV
jgi:hypothetical protein